MRTLIISLLLMANVTFASEEEDFLHWKKQFRDKAITLGITEQTVDQAMASIELLPQVFSLDSRQPEFTQTFLQYLFKRVSDNTVETGRLQLEEQSHLLEPIQNEYGVDATVLIALWGLETSYGRHLGTLHLPSALATLAYQGRRQGFFEEQLFVLLSLVDSGQYALDSLYGSWAGAMGHLQFMPSTLRTYGIDGDQDDTIDLRESLPDAMASAANYLSQIGWKAGEPVAIEVLLPPGFNFQEAQLSIRMPVEEWVKRDVTPASLDDFPQVTGDVAIVLPQGHSGPAFMVFDNFAAIMDWNKSIHYALSVAHLSNRLQGYPELAVQEAAEPPISLAETSQLQELLLTAGFDPGEPDGIAGSKTQSAIRAYQAKHGLVADGYPSQSLLNHMLDNMAQAPSN